MKSRKGCVSVISSHPQCKDCNAWFTERYSWNFVKISSFLQVEKWFWSCLLFTYRQVIRSSLFQRNHKYKSTVFTRTWISYSYLIRQSFYGYRCKSDIVIRVQGAPWNCGNCPLLLFLTFYKLIWIDCSTIIIIKCFKQI